MIPHFGHPHPGGNMLCFQDIDRSVVYRSVQISSVCKMLMTHDVNDGPVHGC
jgi:hypothetical protein